MRHVCWLSGLLAAALATTAQAKCVKPSYAAELSSAAIQAQAQAKALENLSQAVTKVLGDKPSATMVVKANFTVSAAGEVAQGAYATTADEIFCYLREAAATDPARLQEIETQQREFEALIDEYFDFELWQVGSGAQRKAIRDDLTTRKPRTAPLAGQETALLAAIPEFNFDRVKTVNFSVSAEVSSGLTAGVCTNLVQASIRQVNPSVLASLQRLRGTIVEWLARDDVRARSEVWKFASAQMNYAASQSAASMTVNPAVAACVTKAAEIAAKEAEKVAAPPKVESQRTAAVAAPQGS